MELPPNAPPRPDIAQNVPKCPTCGSTDLERISAGRKVKRAALFGVFSLGAVSRQFRCRNCTYEW